MGMSVFCLSILFFVHWFIQDLHRSLHGKNLMCYIVSLISLYSVLIYQYKRLGDHPAYLECAVSGYFLFYSTLATFFWLNILCFEVYCEISSFLDKRLIGSKAVRFLLYLMYGFIVPLLLTICVVSIDRSSVLNSLIPFEYRPNIGVPKEHTGGSFECYISGMLLVKL
jgi:G protein-coupled receptor Mth (Methuselah protein)